MRRRPCCCCACRAVCAAVCVCERRCWAARARERLARRRAATRRREHSKEQRALARRYGARGANCDRRLERTETQRADCFAMQPHNVTIHSREYFLRLVRPPLVENEANTLFGDAAWEITTWPWRWYYYNILEGYKGEQVKW